VAEANPPLVTILEAKLFAAGRTLTIQDIFKLLPEFEKKEIRRALVELQRQYVDRPGGIELKEVAGGYRFQTRNICSKWVVRLKQAAPIRLSKAALETLAIIAYRQPVTRAEIEALRGVDSSGTLRFLLDKQLIKIAGKKEVPGRPLLYGTTKHFLEVFELKDLSSLPSPKDITELDGDEKAQATLPLFQQLDKKQ